MTLTVTGMYEGARDVVLEDTDGVPMRYSFVDDPDVDPPQKYTFPF